MIHTIRPGDTIYSIAREYGVSPALLQANNAITAPEQLVVGQTLVVLFPQTTYTVKQGDTLFSIAKEYQTTVKDLYRNNPSLMGKSDIVPGEELVISYLVPHGVAEHAAEQRAYDDCGNSANAKHLQHKPKSRFLLDKQRRGNAHSQQQNAVAHIRHHG